MLWLFLALKIPLIAACWIVWWAIHAEPEPEDAPPPGGDGGERVRGPERHPRPPLPHAPRRGPHGDDALPSPPRVRGVTDVRSRETTQR
jgi:hypothetical protein